MTDPASPQARRRRTFGPVVALELVAGGLAAYAASKPWVTGEGAESAPGMATVSWGEVSSSPLGMALALVVLACVGVVLVTRGWFRRAVTWLAALAALGYAAAVAYAPVSLPDHLREQVRQRTGTDLDSTSLSGWYWVAVVAAVLVVASTAVAARLVRAWPEMGSRYDAPAGTAGTKESATAEVPSENIDIWKALDEGRDPTA